MGYDIFFHDYAPPDREMLSGSVDADFILALPFHHRELEPYCACTSFNEEGEWLPTAKREVERCSQR